MPIHFKSYLQGGGEYKGGKSKSEIASNGKKIYKLSSNENMLGPSPKAMTAIRDRLGTLSEYPERTDHLFRQALEEFYQGALTAEQFVTTNSGVANIELIMRAFLGENTSCIISNPAFSAYQGFIKKTGAEVIDVPLTGDEFQLDVTGILAAIRPDTSLIFVTNPNNPTGTSLPKSDIDALIDGLPDHVVLVYDEVYYQYVEAEDYVRAVPYVQAGKAVIGVNSFSKAYGLAGLRVGYSYSTPEIANYLRQLIRPFMLNSLSMNAAMGALKDDAFIEQTVSLIHQEKPYLYQELSRLGIKYWKTQANFILIQPPGSAEEFEAALLQEGIMVRQAGPFGAPGCIRVTIGTHEANAAFIKAAEQILATLAG